MNKKNILIIVTVVVAVLFGLFFGNLIALKANRGNKIKNLTEYF